MTKRFQRPNVYAFFPCLQMEKQLYLNEILSSPMETTSKIPPLIPETQGLSKYIDPERMLRAKMLTYENLEWAIKEFNEKWFWVPVFTFLSPPLVLRDGPLMWQNYVSTRSLFSYPVIHSKQELHNQLRCPRLARFPSAGFMANFSHEIKDHCKIDAENTLFDRISSCLNIRSFSILRAGEHEACLL